MKYHLSITCLCTLLVGISILPSRQAAGATILQSRKQSPHQSGDVRTLVPGAPIERELPGGQIHLYRIVLTAGQFALVQVEPHDTDVSLAANGPDGKEFASVNLRWGNEGGELLAIVAEVT